MSDHSTFEQHYSEGCDTDWEGCQQRTLLEKVKQLEQQNARYKQIIDDYACHDNECILNQWSQGEPTKDGYRTMYAGKWYQTRPIDETPKCDCGLAEALQRGQE